MLRITLLIGNIVFSIFLIVMSISTIIHPGIGDEGLIVPLSLVILLSILNIYFIIGTYRGPFSLYLKRKKLEEEIKIQEAENKLKGLRS